LNEKPPKETIKQNRPHLISVASFALKHESLKLVRNDYNSFS